MIKAHFIILTYDCINLINTLFAGMAKGGSIPETPLESKILENPYN